MTSCEAHGYQLFAVVQVFIVPKTFFFCLIINAPPRHGAVRARRGSADANTAPSRTGTARTPPFPVSAMPEVTDQQTREFVQQQGVLDAMRQTQADLEQQLADAADQAQRLAALWAPDSTEDGVSPGTNRKKRRGRPSTPDENEGSLTNTQW